MTRDTFKAKGTLPEPKCVNTECPLCRQLPGEVSPGLTSTILTDDDRKALRAAVRGMVMQASADGVPLNEQETEGANLLLAKLYMQEVHTHAFEVVTDEDIERWRAIDHEMRGSDFYTEANVWDYERERLRRWLEARR